MGDLFEEWVHAVSKGQRFDKRDLELEMRIVFCNSMEKDGALLKMNTSHTLSLSLSLSKSCSGAAMMMMFITISARD